MAKSRPELDSTSPLPRGRHRLSAEEVATNQRERIAIAIAIAIAEDGYGALTVERVIAAAGVSRSTFYAHFGNRQEAVLAAHELIFERFLGSVAAACGSEPEWPLKVSAALDAIVEFAIGRPEQSLILSIGSLAADPALGELIHRSHEHLAKLLGGIRAESPTANQLPACTEELLVLGIGAVIANHLMRGEGEGQDLRSLHGEMVELVLRPYYGAEEARRLAHLPR